MRPESPVTSVPSMPSEAPRSRATLAFGTGAAHRHQPVPDALDRPGAAEELGDGPMARSMALDRRAPERPGRRRRDEPVP